MFLFWIILQLGLPIFPVLLYLVNLVFETFHPKKLFKFCYIKKIKNKKIDENITLQDWNDSWTHTCTIILPVLFASQWNCWLEATEDCLHSANWQDPTRQYHSNRFMQTDPVKCCHTHREAESALERIVTHPKIHTVDLYFIHQWYISSLSN